MVELLHQVTPAFIPPDLWSANSPDLNPVDYSIWECVQQRVYQKPVNDVSQLKQHLTEIWSGVQQTVVDEATDEWRRRLLAGLCPCLGTSFWTSVVISTVVYVFCWHFNVEWLNISRLMLLFVTVNAGVRVFDTRTVGLMLAMKLA